MSRSMFDEGTVSTINGWQGTGKTDISWLFDLYATLQGKTVLTNKKEKKDQETKINHVPISNDIQFFNEFLRRRKDLVVGLDEANLFQSSKRSQTKQNVLLESFIAMIRHFRAAIYMIIQRKGNFLPMIRENAYWELRKISKKEYKLKDTRGNEAIFYNLPSAKDFGINYDTYSWSSFSFKIDLKKLFEHCTDKRYYGDQMKELERIARDDFRGFLLD